MRLRFLAPFFLLSAASAWAQSIEIHSVNGVHRALAPGLMPIEQGPLKIILAAPEHELRVFSNRLSLASGPTGLSVAYEVDLEGFGHLIADIESPSGKSRLEDRVEALRQKIVVKATIELRKLESGYEIALLAADTKTIDIRIKSRLAGDILSFCKVFELIPIVGAIGCDRLGAALTTLKVPMPQAGTRWRVDNGALTATERSYFDQFADS
jgi:hypothetical protein